MWRKKTLASMSLRRPIEARWGTTGLQNTQKYARFVVVYLALYFEFNVE